MSRQRSLFLTLFLVAAPVPALAETQPVPRFEPAPCPTLEGAEALAEATCGYLVVPENRSQPNGRTIRLMVAKYPARSPEKRPDPVVYLAGGPGDIVPLEVNGLIAADFIRDRDIVAMSQRGTMFSEPALTCAAIDDFARELLGLRFYSEATKRAHLAATEACHRELAATGADLSAYNSTESAADFADLRKVLGYARGMSTGLPMAPTLRRRSCATTRRASAASSSIRSCRRPTTSPQTGGTRAPASTTSSRPARRNRPATRPIPISRKPSPDWSTSSRPSR